MEKSRAVYVILFVVAVALIAGSLTNWLVNIVPQYTNIDWARVNLWKAQDTLTGEEKSARINEAIRLYRKGPNLEKLQLLTPTSTIEEFDKAKSSLDAEFWGHIITADYLATCVCQVIFFSLTFKGSTSHHKILWIWGKKKQYFFFAMTLLFLLLALLVIFL